MCQDTGSNVDCDEFAIIDKRSREDSTLVLVQEPRKEYGGLEFDTLPLQDGRVEALALLGRRL